MGCTDPGLKLVQPACLTGLGFSFEDGSQQQLKQAASQDQASVDWDAVMRADLGDIPALSSGDSNQLDGVEPLKEDDLLELLTDDLDLPVSMQLPAMDLVQPQPAQPPERPAPAAHPKHGSAAHQTGPIHDGDMGLSKKRGGAGDAHKRAQAKYRQRQKVRLETAERQVEELQAKVAQLELQQKSLQAQNAILSRVAQMRHTPPAAAAPAAPVGQSDVEQLVDAIERLLIKGWGVGDTLLITVTQPHRRMTRQELRDMSKESFRELYNEYVNQMAASLVAAAGSDDGHPARRRVEELAMENEAVFVIKATGCSNHLRFVRSVNLGCTKNHWGAINGNAAYWENIVQAVNFTPEQLEDCILLREFYLRRLGQIMRSRQKLASKLAWMEDYAYSHTDATCRFDDGKDALAAMRESFKEEYRAFMHIYAAQSQGIRTAFQTGVACVQCHPWCPDGIGMLDHISLRGGKPSAHIILKEEVEDAAVDLQWEAVSSYVEGLSPSQLNEHVPFAQHVRKFLLAKGK